MIFDSDDALRSEGFDQKQIEPRDLGPPLGAGPLLKPVDKVTSGGRLVGESMHGLGAVEDVGLGALDGRALPSLQRRERVARQDHGRWIGRFGVVRPLRGRGECCQLGLGGVDGLLHSAVDLRSAPICLHHLGRAKGQRELGPARLVGEAGDGRKMVAKFGGERSADTRRARSSSVTGGRTSPACWSTLWGT